MHDLHPDPDLPALGIRQPWAELILRGIKTVEVRSQNTRVRGPIYIYVGKKPAEGHAADRAIRQHALDMKTLPRGVVVGTVEIRGTGPMRSADAGAACLPVEAVQGKFGWQLTSAQRLPSPLDVNFLPYGVWFYPWKRRGSRRSRPTA